MKEEVEMMLSKAESWGNKEEGLEEKGYVAKRNAFLICGKLVCLCMKREKRLERGKLKMSESG